MNPAEPDIDLHALHLLRQVAKYRGFTAAARACGISQSALTRQVQSIEARLGIKVFDRTTRTVTITEPGAVLLRETEAIPNILSGAMRRIREDYMGARREIRIGISKDLALSHIPGIFHDQQRLQPDVRIIVSQPEEKTLVRQTAGAELDLGILTLPDRLPETVEITHRMADQFTIVAPSTIDAPSPEGLPAFRKWAAARNWLLPPLACTARHLIERWALEKKVILQSVMELENFDLMVHLASMGMGTAFVPRRSISGFQRKKLVRIIPPPVEIARQLVVIAPRHSKTPEHVMKFVEGILFS